MSDYGLLNDLHEGVTKAVLFDLDGTIFDSVESHVEELKEIWRRLKLPAIDPEKVKEIMARGQAFWDCLEELLPWMTPKEREDIKTRGIETDKELWKDVHFVREFNRFVPRAVEVLKTLKDEGFSVGLVSSVKREWGDAIFYTFREAEIDPEEFFDVIIMREDVPRMKPFPDPVLEGIRRLKTTPHQCLYVGDSPNDIRCGKAAGVKTAGVLTGVGTSETLSPENPDFILQSIADLIR